jgi:sugar/nucleoside kinase (ribokinase family)
VSEVVVIGAASLNVIVELDALPQPHPHTVTARQHWRTLGGTSAGKSLHLAALGRDTTCVTVVGSDADGTAIVEELTAAEVTVLALAADGPSEHHLNLMTRAGERLSIYLDSAPSIAVSRDERASVRAALADARAVALDLSALGAQLVDEVRASELPVWVDLHDYDGVNPFHEAFIEVADVVLMNGDGMEDPVAFLRSRVSAGAFAGVCTLGADGAAGIASDGEIVHVPAQAVEVVDTNGAGDAFAAGMIDSLLRLGAVGTIDGPTLRAAMAAGASQATTALRSRGLGPAQAS